jgi:hypothetical protein
MDYEHSREVFQEACRKHLVHFVRVDARNDIWQAVAPISHEQVKAIMDEANLVWQQEFEDFTMLDNCCYVEPKEFEPDTNQWGMAFDLVDGYVYMNLH